jgi:hypothetical protein
MNLRLPRKTPQGTRAFAVILILALLAFMGSFALHNAHNLAHLEKELRLVEHGQIERLKSKTGNSSPAKRTSNDQR